MLHDIVKKDATDRSVTVKIIDSGDGTPETGVVFNTAGIDLWYRREGAAKTTITEATLAALTTAHTDGGFLHIADGVYRLDLPDAAFATGANYVDFGGTVTGMIVIGGRVRLVNVDLEDTVRAGLTALPNAAADAAGGLPISDAGGLDLDAQIGTDIDAILVDTGTTLQGELDGIQADTEDIQTRLPAALVGGRIDATVDATGMEAGAVAAIADGVWDEAATGHTDAGKAGEQLWTDLDAVLVDTGTTLQGELDGIQTDTEDIQARLPAALTADGNIKADTLRIGGTLQTANDVGADVNDILADTADMQPKLGTPAGVSISADIAAIEGQTDDIGAAGAGLTAVPWNAAWDAEVQSEVTDALNAYDPPTRTEATADKDEILTQLPAAPVKNATFTYVIKMVLASDHVTPATGLTVVMTRSLDGAAFGAATGTITEISTGHYKVAASAADMNGDVVAHRFAVATADDLTIVMKTVA